MDKITLDDHQKFMLMKFRRNVQDIIQPHHDDRFLLRWLRARSWNAEAAEKMLRESMKWRQQWEVDTALKKWQPPEFILPYFPCGTTGFDKEGSPVIVVPFAGFDIVGFLHSVGRQDVIKILVKKLEEFMELAGQKGGHKLTVVFDLENFSLRPYAWRPAAELVIALLQMYEANYPEILKACFLINAPKVFAIAFNVVKRFLNEYTIGKMQIIKNDPKKWQKILLQHIDPDNLPKHFGGNLVDPDGNPRYTTAVVQGGKIPKEFYQKQLDKNDSLMPDKDYKTVVIKQGEKLSLDFIVAEDGCFLKWDFHTEGHDIRFGITMTDADGNSTPVVRHKRIAAHQMNEFGVVACQAPATYTVVFDNTYSIMRSKKLQYDVTVSPPLDKLNISDMESSKEVATSSQS